VFYAEMFARISKAYGYIRTAMYAHSTVVKLLKAFDHEYDARDRYDFGDATPAQTVKVRVMKAVQAGGGTDTLGALQIAARDLNREKEAYSDGEYEYASALYYMGDGSDGMAERSRAFLSEDDPRYGFGDHMRSASVFGGEAERSELAAVFGDKHTTVANSFQEIVRQQMLQFDRDISEHLASLGVDI